MASHGQCCTYGLKTTLKLLVHVLAIMANSYLKIVFSQKNLGISNFQRPYLGVAPRWRLGVWNFENPQKFDPPGGPDYSTANSKSKLPKIYRLIPPSPSLCKCREKQMANSRSKIGQIPLLSININGHNSVIFWLRFWCFAPFLLRGFTWVTLCAWTQNHPSTHISKSKFPK